jgi:ribosomal protein L11 methylase PrmA
VQNAVNQRQPGALVRCLQATGIHHREIRRSQPYDLVFANILAGPLVALAPDLCERPSRAAAA